jgi:hypothetical protein
LFAGLLALIDKHLKWINSEEKKEDKRLLAIVAQRFSLDDLYKLDAQTPPDINFSRVTKRRGAV